MKIKVVRRDLDLGSMIQDLGLVSTRGEWAGGGGKSTSSCAKMQVLPAICMKTKRGVKKVLGVGDWELGIGCMGSSS
jgi:hypothetical protein